MLVIRIKAGLQASRQASRQLSTNTDIARRAHLRHSQSALVGVLILFSAAIAEAAPDSCPRLTEPRKIEASLYPENAAEKGIEGWVDLTVRLNPDGSISDTVVVASEFPFFEAAAIRAASLLTYCAPGRVAKTDRAIRVSFELSSDETGEERLYFNGDEELVVLGSPMRIAVDVQEYPSAIEADQLYEHPAILPDSEAEAVLTQCTRLTPKAESYFTPDADQVDLAEAELIEGALGKFSGAPDVPFDQYARQYVGFRSHGRPFLYLNATRFFKPVESAWREHAVEMCDGGDSSWGAVFSLTEGKFVSLSVNDVL